MNQGLPVALPLAHDHDQEAHRMMIMGEAVEGGDTRETDAQGRSGEGEKAGERERESGRKRKRERESEREREREREF